MYTEDHLRGCPTALRPLVLRFPPGCKVRARAGVSLGVPAPGQVGRVVGWGNTEKPLHYKCSSCDDWHGGDDPEEVMVEAIRGDRGAVCTPEQLEVVRYGDVTPELLADLWYEAER
jgi:hypothetical protein